MAVKILIPTPLRPYVDGRDTLELEGASVGELLERLAGEHTALKQHLFAADGRLRSFVNVYVNDRDIRRLEHQETDRKSTRLNSSHSQISYAVFCLKKKYDPLADSHQHFICQTCGRVYDILGGKGDE